MNIIRDKDLVFNYALQFEDGTWYTGYASTLEESITARTLHKQHALTYTEQRAHEIKNSFPSANLTVVRIN